MLLLNWKMKKRKEKRSTCLLFFAMFLGVAGMMTALFFIRSMKMNELEDSLKTWGNYDFSFYDISDRLAKQLEGDERIGKTGIVYEFADGTVKENDQTLTLGALKDEDTQELFYIPPIEGHYPQKENEICVDRLTLKECGFQGKLGEKITLCVQAKDSAQMLEKEYTLSGIVELKATKWDGTVYCRRKASVDSAEQSWKGTDTSEARNFPMAYVYAPEAMEEMPAPIKHYFVTLKELTDKNRYAFYDEYYTSEKWENDFCFGNDNEPYGRTDRKTEIIHYVLFEGFTISENFISDIMENHTGTEDFYTKYMVPVLLFLIGLITAISIYDAVRISIEEKKRQYSILLCLGMTGWRLAGGICVEFFIYFFLACGLGGIFGCLGYQGGLFLLEHFLGIHIPSSFLVDPALEYYMPYINEVTRSPFVLPMVVLMISCLFALVLSLNTLVRMMPLDVESSTVHKVKRKKRTGLYSVLNRYVGRGPKLNQLIPWLCIFTVMSMGVFGYLLFKCKAELDYRQLQQHIEDTGMGNFDYYMNRTTDTVNSSYLYFEGRHDTGVTQEEYQELAASEGVKEIHGIVVNRSTALVYNQSDIKATYLNEQNEYIFEDQETLWSKAYQKLYETMGVGEEEKVFNVPSVGVQREDLEVIAAWAGEEDASIQVKGTLDAEKLASGEEVVVLIRNQRQSGAFEIGEELPLCDFVLPEEMDSKQQIVSGKLPEEYQTEEKAYHVSVGEETATYWNYYSRVQMHPKVGAIILLNEWEDNFYFEDFQGATVNILTLADAFEQWGLPDRNYTRIGAALQDVDGKEAEAFQTKWLQTVSKAKYMSAFDIQELVYTTGRGQRNVMAIFYVLMFLLFVMGLLATSNIVAVRMEQMRSRQKVLDLLGMTKGQLIWMYILRFGRIVMAGAVVSLVPVEAFASFCRLCRNMRIEEYRTNTEGQKPWINLIPNFEYDNQPVLQVALVVLGLMLFFVIVLVLGKSRRFGMQEMQEDE